MVDCIKKQNENYKGTKQTRCINRDSDLFKQLVIPEQCAGCPVLMLRKQKPAPCLEQLQKPMPPVIEPSGYPACPFRYESKTGLKCSMTNLPVDLEICGRCDEGTREQEAKLGTKVRNYFGAVRRWVANGRPSRSEEEIEKLFETHCKDCERYDEKRHACKNCGCTVSTDASPLANKLAMASEGCPLGRF